MTPRVPEPAELADDLARLERAIEASAASTKEAIDRLISEMKREYVRKETYELKESQQDKAINGIQEGQRWMVRAVVVSLLFPILVTLIIVVIIGAQS